MGRYGLNWSGSEQGQVAEKHSDDRHTMGTSQEGLCSQAQKLGSYRCCYDWSRLTSQFESNVLS